MTLEYKLYYERHLPHIQPPGATFFVTYRLANTIPTFRIRELLAEKERANALIEGVKDPGERDQRRYLEQKRLFGLWDLFLDAAQFGPRWLEKPDAAQIVVDSLEYLDSKVFDLDTFCLMCNHVHVIFTPLFNEKSGKYHSISSIMQVHKRYTAVEINKLLQRKGQFWQHESYDHIVRDREELNRIRRYILQNPVRAGLVDSWEDWPWSRCKYLVEL